LFYEKGEMQNPQRMMRALEVVESTGQSILSYRKKEKKNRPFATTTQVIEISKEELQRNINTRIARMVEEGLVDEARSLISFRDLNALQTVGYSEIFDHLDGKISLEQAIQLINTHTWQYAKRQMTWLRKKSA
jgi:tRNA dimethylallyltransferase